MNMDLDIQRARQELAHLPDSVKKEEALHLLAEIEESDAKQNASLEKLERALEKHGSVDEFERLFRWVRWFSVLLGLMATYGGIAAIVSREFCASSRSTWSCSYGVNAQINGAVELLIGLLLLLLAMPDSRWRTLGLWIFGLSLAPTFFSVLLVR